MTQRLDQQTLDSIAEEFATAIRLGESPSVDDYVSRHDDPSGELRSLLTSIAMIEGLKGPATANANNESLRLQQLDDYQIVREIGRGGMGIVFEAIHQSLGRRVALKVLSKSLLDRPKHHARFRREARAAARLRHPNIVSVFGVGQSGEHHYYVMDFIRGMSLREWLQSLTGDKDRFMPTRAESLAESEQDFQFDTATVSSDATATSFANVQSNSSLSDAVPIDTDSPEYFCWVAKIGVMVCDALQYAHDQGVLHRDIKPANLLLDQKGGVWIADFGLAKLMETDATNSGDIVGTPQYMSPESFDGKYNEASENYCVGLTLYELLTLRPAIEGKNAGDTIRKATEGVKTNPRRLNQRIPRDLETIVLKSLSKETQNRYAAAKDLRDDLQRFLDDRPIRARRVGLGERLYRWTRREPALASLTLGVFALLFSLAIVTSLAYWKTKNALADARVARLSAETSAEVATEQSKLAQSNLQVAIRAFEEISQRIVDRGNEPDAELLGDINESVSLSVKPEDAELLQSLLTFFDELAQNNSEDEQLKLQTAAARKRVGDIYFRLGKFSDADKSYRHSLEIYEEISDSANPVSDELIITQARLLNERALIAGLKGNTSSANHFHSLTLDLLESSDSAMKSAEGRFEHARANSLFSQISTRSGINAMGRGSMQRRGRLWFMAARPFEELMASDVAIDALDSLTTEFPDDRRYGIALARAHRDRANATLTLGEMIKPGGPDREVGIKKGFTDVARRRMIGRLQNDLIKAQTSLRRYLREDPDSQSIKYELAKTLVVVPKFVPPDLRAQLRERVMEARRLCNQLLQESPNSPRYLALQAECVEQSIQMGRSQRAQSMIVRQLEDLFSIQQLLLKVSPGLSKHLAKLADTAIELSWAYTKDGKKEAAIDCIAKSESILRSADSSPVVRSKLQMLRSRRFELQRGK